MILGFPSADRLELHKAQIEQARRERQREAELAGVLRRAADRQHDVATRLVAIRSRNQAITSRRIPDEVA